MRLRRQAPLLFLIIPALTLASSNLDSKSELDARAAIEAEAILDTVPSSPKGNPGTKDAPVDGKDGKPHEGPFVFDKTEKSDESDLKPVSSLKDSPKDKYEGIPEANDGVMDDPTHQKPKGTTGTEGGVTEKGKAKKAKEGMTGEKVENVPETPKEQPPLPHSEQEKILGEKDSSKTSKQEKARPAGDGKQIPEDVAGLEKPVDLPNKIKDSPNPVPDSAKKDHLDVSKPAKQTPKQGVKQTVDGDEGIIQPFHSFVLSLTMILFSEIGDKTFLVAALMAMKHDRMVVFSAAYGALFIMTVLSAVLGHTVPALIPKKVTAFLAAGLFFVFGAKLLREGMAMSPEEGVTAEMQEVEMELQQKEHEAIKQGRRRNSVYAMEGGYGGNSRSRKSRSQTRFPTPPRSPSTSPPRSPSPRGVFQHVAGGVTNLCSLLLSPAWVQTFVMTFLGEWGDRSQIATIAMAAGQDYWWVTLGAAVGHACCTGVAVVGGRAIAGKVSLKVGTSLEVDNPSRELTIC
jgi:Ca2+/H+ antiporter, TMEM165/GDT1 family